MASFNVSEIKSFVDCYRDHPVYLGVDVHKISYHIAVLRADGQVRTMVVPADPLGVLRLIHRLDIKLGALAYETGPTGFVLARTLETAGLPVIVAAASRIPRTAAPSAKTDQLDCRRLAQFAAKGLLRPIAVPTEEQEAERTLIRRRNQLSKGLRVCKNRIRSLLLEFNMPEPPKLSNWSKRAMDALERMPLPNEALFTLNSHLTELRFLIAQRDAVMTRLEQIGKKNFHEKVMSCLQSVPGVGPQVAAAFRLEVFQPERFRNAEELGGYLGLAPVVRQSGQDKGSRCLQPVGKTALRSLLVEAAWKFKAKDPRARSLYNKLLSKHGVPQKALVAVARKLAVMLWRLSLEQRPYELRLNTETA